MRYCAEHAHAAKKKMMEFYPGFPDLTPPCSLCCQECMVTTCFYKCNHMNECKERNGDMPKKKETTEVTTAPASTMVDDNRKIITEMLMKTDRDGIEDLVTQMGEMGFWTAPASGGNHLHMEGGLAQHSLNVAQAAEKIGLALLGAEEFNKVQNSVLTCALLHDLGKCGDWGKALYVENILKTGKRSEAKPWKRNPELTNIPHGIRSVLIIQKYLFDLTEDEEYAIMYHDGLYEPSNVAVVKGHESVLYMILHWADMWASHVLEGGDADEAD